LLGSRPVAYVSTGLTVDNHAYADRYSGYQVSLPVQCCSVVVPITSTQCNLRSDPSEALLRLPSTPDLLSELWEAISYFACTDDGQSGQSLALVSKSVNHGTHRYRLQSASVIGLVEAERFLRILDLRPAELRIVRFLYLYVAGIAHSKTDLHDYYKVPLHHAESESICLKIIADVAPHIEVLTLGSSALRLPSELQLPFLRDLSVPGDNYINEEDVDPPAIPSLHRIHLWDCSSIQPGTFESALLRCAPNLACLRISGPSHQQDLVKPLSNLLGRHPESSAELVHPTLRLIVVEPHTAPYAGGCGSLMVENYRMVQALRRFAETSFNQARRFVLLHTTSSKIQYSSSQAYEDWLEAISSIVSEDFQQSEGPWISNSPKVPGQ
jgi:hypothetical protein